MRHITTQDLDSTNPYKTLPPQWGEEAVRIMLDAEPSRAARQRRRLWTVLAAGGLIVAGGTGVAVATPLLQRPVLAGEVIPFVVTVGEDSCPATIQVHLQDPFNRTLNTPEGMAAAEKALRGIDFATLDTGTALTGEPAPGSSHPEVEKRAIAISSMAVQIVNQAIQDQGFTEEVTISSSTNCEPE